TCFPGIERIRLGAVMPVRTAQRGLAELLVMKDPPLRQTRRQRRTAKYTVSGELRVIAEGFRRSATDGGSSAGSRSATDGGSSAGSRSATDGGSAEGLIRQNE